MIECLLDKHKGRSIAIVGSSPTAKLYKEKEEITIAVNGSSKLKKRIDYFVTSHPTAYLKSWFSMPKKITRIINSISAIHSKEMYPDKKIRERILRDYEASLKDNYQLDKDTKTKFNVFFNKIPKPSPPHILFYFGDLNIDPLKMISKKQKVIYSGGTSSCAALQIANIMGASEIHLYGCSFNNTPDNPKEKRYFYKARKNEKGRTTESQIKFMDKTIKKVASEGTKVFVHGYSRLKEPLRIS